MSQPGESSGQTKGPSGGSRASENPKRKNQNGKTPRNKKSSANGKPNGDSKPRKRTGKPQKKQIQRDPAKDYKFLEVKKLIRHFTPLTVNGIPPDIIKKRAEANSTTEEMHKRNHVEDFILLFITSQPDQPIHLSFQVKPSDPDFPYDVSMLNVSLSVPPTYPYDKQARPSIYVLNEEIPRGFSVNLEIGFRRIAAVAMGVADEEIQLVEGKGLLSQIKTLDKYMEFFLRQEKKETIKIVKTKKREKTTSPEKTPETTAPKPAAAPAAYVARPVEVPAELASERARLIQEMNDKFGRDVVKVFKKSAAENKYKVILPISVHKESVPAVWRNNGKVEVFLHVPGDYPQSKTTILMPPNFTKNLLMRYSDMDEANRTNKQVRAVEKNIERNYKNLDRCGPPQSTLVCEINWLHVNFGVLCLTPPNFDEWKRCITQQK